MSNELQPNDIILGTILHSMEEDEEVLLENSHMHNILRQNGFLKVETKSVYNLSTNKPKVLLTAHPIQKSGRLSDDYIVKEEILAIKATNLLFEDDLNHIDYVLSNIELKNDHLLRHIFKGSSCAIVIIIGLCLYLILGVYAIFFVSIYYTYRTSDYLWNKHKRSTMLETLIETVKSNMFLLNKILKFVHENDNLVKLRLGGELNGIAVKNLLTLKNSLLQHQIKFNKVFVNATSTLLKNVPLLEEIDDTDKYLCNSIECNSNTESNLVLHNRYMLLQSQFLARLAFSLVPCLHSYPSESNELVYKTMYKLMAHLQDLNASLNKTFTFTLMNGFYPDQNKCARPLENPKPERSSSEEMLVRNVHDLSNSLQYSLIKARELELTLERREKVTAECELEAIQKELTICQSHIADLLILQKKPTAGLVNDKRSAKFDTSGCEFLTSTELGYSDLDPKVEDDIFEAIINETVDASNVLCCDEDIIDPLAKKKRRQMLVELKDRLRDKAEEWLERETLIRIRKGLPLPDETVTTSQEDSLSSSDCGKSTRRKNYRERYGDSSSEEECDYKPSIEFQRALLETRQAFVDQTEHYDWDGTEDEN